MTRPNFSILLAIALLTIGCATSQTVVVTATPAPVQRQLSDYADLIDPAIAQALAESTAMAGARMLTQQAADQMATQAAADRAQAEAEQARVYATQAALAAAGTATTGAIALEQQRLATTATAEAIAFMYSVSTQEAARADAARIDAEARERDAYYAEQDRQSQKTFHDGVIVFLGALGLIVLVGAANLFEVYRRKKIAEAQADLEERAAERELKRLVVVNGHVVELIDGEGWRLLPGLPDRVVEAPHTMPVINRRAPLETPEPVDAARAQRDAWRDACRRFLLWGEAPHPDDGQPAGYSMRRWRAVTGCTLADWNNSKNLLLQLGILVNSSGTYAIREGMDAAHAGRLPVWATSFDFDADVKIPEVPDPVAIQDGTYSTAQDATARQNAVYAANLAVPFDLEGEPMD